ncbi:hypothetical protein ABK040_007795 [Willaertia magna]
MQQSLVTRAIRSIVPPLSHHFHKGQAGRIAVIGGNEEYTGAPYYAAISSLKTGSDLSFIICSKSASIIKSYSPELIVYPYLKEKEEEIKENLMKEAYDTLFKRFNSIVMGPGLGRTKEALQQAEWFISYCHELNLPLVLDGDSLFLISQKPQIVMGHENVILTPNPNEFKNLFKAVIDLHNKNNNEKKDEKQFSSEKEELIFVSKELGNVCIVRKGQVDLIAKGDNVISCELQNASPRRCGGQGDVLSGVLGTFCHWARWKRDDNNNESDEDRLMIACYCSCLLAKKAAQLAFQVHHRSTTTPNIIDCLGKAFDELFTTTQ